MAKQQSNGPKSTRPDPDVDGGYAWIILAGCFVMYLCVVGTIKAYGVLYTEMVSYYGTGSGNTAWIGSAVLLFMLGLSPIANMLSRRFSFRRVSFVGGILLGSGYFLSGFCRKMEFMFLSFGLCGGLGYGLTFAPCSTIISYYFDKNRALANGVAVSASGIGALVFPFLYRFLIEKYSLLGAFWIVGGILLNACAAACVFRQPRLLVEEKKRRKAAFARLDGRDQKELLNGKDSNISHEEPSCCERHGINLKLSLFRNPRFSMYCLAFMFCMNGYGNNLILIPAQIKALGYDRSHVVYGVTIMGGCEVVARIFFGWLADRKVIKRKHIFLTSMFLAAVFSFITPLFKSFTYMGIYAAIIGTFPGSFWSLISVLLIDVVGLENFTPAFGLTTLGLAFGIVLSQPAVGWLEDSTGSWDASFYLTGCLLSISGIIVCLEPLIIRFFMPREKDQEDRSEFRETSRQIDIVVADDTGSLLGDTDANVKFTSPRISRIYRPLEQEKHKHNSPRSPVPVCDTSNV